MDVFYEGEVAIEITFNAIGSFLNFFCILSPVYLVFTFPIYYESMKGGSLNGKGKVIA